MSALSRDFIYTCPSRVFKDQSLTSNELRIYMIVRSFMDTTGDAYPSNNWIANEIGSTRITVIRAINKLVSKSYLHRIEINGKRHLSISVPIPEELVSSVIPPSIIRDTPPSITADTQLYQSNIISKNINIYPREENFDYTEIEDEHEFQEIEKSDYFNNHQIDTQNDTQVIESEMNKEKSDYCDYKTNKRTKKKNKKQIVPEYILNNNPHQIPEDHILEWQAYRKHPITPRVWNKTNIVLSELNDKGIDSLWAFEYVLERQWQGIEVRFFKDEINYRNNKEKGRGKSSSFDSYLADLNKQNGSVYEHSSIPQ